MHTHCVYSTNNPVLLTLFPSPSTSKQISQLLFVNITFFFWKSIFFAFFMFTGYFAFNFVFFYFGFIWLLSVLVIFYWSCCNFFLQGELVLMSDFSPRWFVRFTNLETFKQKQLLCYECFPLQQASQSISSRKLSGNPKLAANYQYLLQLLKKFYHTFHRAYRYKKHTNTHSSKTCPI